MTATITQNDVKQALAFAIALAQTIHAAGPGGIPSGHLYAQVMGKADLPYYQAALDMLKAQGCIKEAPSHLLTSLLPR